VKVTNDHFSCDFLHLDEEPSCLEIAVELSFQDRESVFDDLSSWIDNVIELMSHFLTVSTANNLILPGADWDNRIGMKVFPDQPMNRFRVVSFVHDVTIGLPGFVALSE